MDKMSRVLLCAVKVVINAKVSPVDHETYFLAVTVTSEAGAPVTGCTLTINDKVSY